MGDDKLPSKVKHFEEDSKVLQEMPLWKFRADARENRDKGGGGGTPEPSSSQQSGGGSSVAAILLENDSELLLEDGSTTIDIE